MTTIVLPTTGGGWSQHVLSEPRTWAKPAGPFAKRAAFAAAHVVADSRAGNVPGGPPAVDWDATLSFRAHLFSYGFGVAEAMDTAQRGMGMDWPSSQELVRRTAALAAGSGARVAAGAGTDHLPADASLYDVLRGYEEQLAFIEGTGAQAILMASRQLASSATGPDDYLKVYDHLLSQASRPVILHWLGTAFDPALAGYWGASDVATATQHMLELVHDHAEKVDGVKVSLLDAHHERGLRAALPAGVRLYTGDDFNYPELIRGDGTQHSDALLGIFAAIAPAASVALQSLDADDLEAYDEIFATTVPLARQVFGTPTYYYKTGIAFLSWLSGHQPGFTMVGGLQSARSAVHLAEAFRLADAARLFPDPDLAARRMTAFLTVSGLER
jgi:hypothetical protein